VTDQNQPKALSKEQMDYVIILYSSGQYQDAIDQIKILNDVYPNVPFLFNLIGACYKELGRLEAAVKMFGTAVDIKPDYAEAHKNLGITLRGIGQLEDAVKTLKKAIEVDSGYVDAHYNLAITLNELGQYDEAINSYEKAIAINRNFADAHNNLGNLFKDLGQTDKAIKSYIRAIEISPQFAHAHNNLGTALIDHERFDDAVKSYNKAIEINPKFYEAHNNLGQVLNILGQFKAGVDSFKKAIEINPRFAEAYYNFGLILKELKHFDDAINNFHNAVSIKPDFFEALNNIGSCLSFLGRVDEAIKFYEKALIINSDYAYAHHDLGNALILIGQSKVGVNSIEKAIEINPEFAEAHKSLGNFFKTRKQRDKSQIYFETAYKIKSDMDFLFGEILNNQRHLCAWTDSRGSLIKLEKKIVNNEKVIDPFALLSLVDNPVLQRKAAEIKANSDFPKNNDLPTTELYPKHSKIRIGYFSGDFKIHPVSTLTAQLYEMHNRDHFEIHAFSFGKATNDEMNLRIKAGVDQFHDVDLMSHKDIVLLSRSLEIDIAIDLSGFTAKARTDIFAMSVAPIQLSYIGYLGSMGAEYYDYLIADPVMIPKESQKYYMEKIVYLPSFQVNDSKDLPPNIVMSRKVVGLPDKGFVFCCFNNTYKITPTTFDSWARILKAVEDSVLIIFANNELSKANLTKEIKKRGVAAERLIFGESVSRPQYLARFRVADLFLDTQPYNAGTTASDALKMGLPMLTIKGEAYQARMGASIVNALNLPELITTSTKEYESLAIELAKNPEKLNKLKEKLQNNLSTAPLFDTPLFTKNLESAYTQMYERYHKGLEPDHIYI
jgi:protein O-GlcNAc transferase